VVDPSSISLGKARDYFLPMDSRKLGTALARVDGY
jgi:hypothetical protein